MPPVPLVSWPGTFPLLQTEGLLMRQFREDDLPGLFRCLSDPETVRYIMEPVEEPETLRGVLEDYIHGYDRGVSLNWALEDREGGGYAGSVSLHEFSFHDGLAEIAFEIDRSFSGRGLMSEALTAALDFGFRTLGLNRIEARVVEGNQRSEGLLLRLGFRPEGTLRQAFLLQGAIRDIHLYGLLATDRGE